MRKIKFYLGTGYAGADHEEVFEYEDGATDKEIDDDFENWKNEQLDAQWWEIGDED